MNQKENLYKLSDQIGGSLAIGYFWFSILAYSEVSHDFKVYFTVLHEANNVRQL